MGQLADPGRDRAVGIDEQLAPVHDFPVLHLHGTEFDDGILPAGQTRGLEVENDIVCTIQTPFIRMSDDVIHRIHDIHLAAVNHREVPVGIGFLQGRDFVLSQRESLNDSVVRHGNARHAPVPGLLDVVFNG